MDGIFPDMVASIRRLNEIKTSLVVMAIFAGVHPCVGMTAPLHLTSFPESAADKADFTMSCTPAQGRTLIGVAWYRNIVNMFVTSSDASESAAILRPLATSPEYQSVSGRISVRSSGQQHNVTLRTNSSIDQGSVWRCQSGQQFSNNLTIEVKESMQDASSPGPESTRDSTTLATELQHTGPPSTDEKDMMTTNPADTKCGNILPITAAAGSVIVVIVIVVAIVTSVLLVRNYKQDIAESNDQMYSTMSRDHNTDNIYTELDHGHTGEKFPTSLCVNTEESQAYYNTAPADNQYENPPASTE